MNPNDLARNERLDESLESVRQARRRERALLRSPVTAPTKFSSKDMRRFYKEASDELERRG